MNRKINPDNNDIIRKFPGPIRTTPDVRPGIPFCTIRGCNTITIENFKDILEYSQNFIRITFRSGRIEITGTSLEITSFSMNEIHIQGILKKIEYI